jgi:hypothetical protein
MHRKQISFARHRWPLALLVVLPCAWFWPLLAGYLPDFMDTVTQIWPMRVAAALQVQSGTVPLWLPNIFSGVPCAANPQIAVFYPPQVLFHLWPTPFCYSALCVLHYVIGGIGAYLAGFRLTRDRLAAFYGALTLQSGSMLVSHIALTPHLYTSVWVPWMIWAIEGTHARQGRRGAGDAQRFQPALLLAAFLALQILAGAPQITYYTMLLLPVYAVVRWLAARGWRGIWRPLAQVEIAYLLAVFIAGVQLLLTLVFVQETRRGAIDPARLREQALNGSYLWRALVGFTGKGFEDTDTINAIGFGALALVAFGLARRATRARTLPFVAVGIVAWLLAIGAAVPVWSTLLPMFSSFHAPRRALVLWSVMGPIAAAVGAHGLRWWLRRRGAPGWVFPAALLVSFAGTAWIVPRLEREFVRPERFDADPRYLAEIGGARYITIDPTLNYSYGSRRESYGKSMLPDLACGQGGFDAQGYDPLVFGRYAMARDLACARTGVFFPSHGVFFTNPDSHILALLNVQYVVGRWDLFDPSVAIPGTSLNAASVARRLELVHDDPEWPLFRYRDERPLAWAARRVLPAPGPQAAIASLSIGDPRGIAFVEGATAGEDYPTTPPAVRARMADARTYIAEIDPAPVAPLTVCFAVPFTSGWRAYDAASGGELRVLPANGFLCSVRVGAGTRGVRLVYEPGVFRGGVVVSAAGLAAWLALFIVGGRRRGRPA